MQQQPSLDTLPPDTLFLILKKFKFSDLTRFLRLTKRFESLIHSQDFWEIYLQTNNPKDILKTYHDNSSLPFCLLRDCMKYTQTPLPHSKHDNSDFVSLLKRLKTSGRQKCCQVLVSYEVVRETIRMDPGAWDNGLRLGVVEVVEMLIGSRPECENPATRLLEKVISADQGTAEVVHYLAAHPKVYKNFKAMRADTLTAVINKGYHLVLKEIIDSGNPLLSQLASFTLPLRVSALNGHTDAIRLLIDGGADPTIFDNLALQGAIIEGHLDVVKLIQAHKRTDPLSNDYLLLKLAYSAKRNSKAILEMLLEGEGPDSAVRKMFLG